MIDPVKELHAEPKTLLFTSRKKKLLLKCDDNGIPGYLTDFNDGRPFAGLQEVDPKLADAWRKLKPHLLRMIEEDRTVFNAYMKYPDFVALFKDKYKIRHNGVWA